MRYENLTLDFSTTACDKLLRILEPTLQRGPGATRADYEMINLANELRARLQRRDPDPKAKQPPVDNSDLV